MNKAKQMIRPLTIKAISETGTFEGYGSVFGTVDSYRDIVLPGAFAKSLADHKANGTMPALLWQHDPAEPIGVYTEMSEDDHGLQVKGQLIVNQNVPNADKAYALLKAQAVRGLSIGFSIPKGGETFDEDANVWELSEIDLWETSIVTFPANRDAEVTDVRALIGAMEKRELEAFLRDAGLSKRQTLALLSGGYAAFHRGELDERDDADDADALPDDYLETLNRTFRHA